MTTVPAIFADAYDPGNAKDAIEDEEKVDSLDLNVCKSNIRHWSQQRREKKEYADRLAAKLQYLSKELARKREQVEQRDANIRIEQEKAKKERDSRTREKQEKLRAQNQQIQSMVEEILYSRSSGDDKNRRRLDYLSGKEKVAAAGGDVLAIADKGGELAVDKVKDRSGKSILVTDTLVITFQPPGDPNNLRYHLSYRVDSTTTIKQLRGDACKYWGVPEQDYVLKTMANSKVQDEILVNNCFRQGEIAVLRLSRRDQRNTVVSEAEEKAIMPIDPKTGTRKPKRYGAEGGPIAAGDDEDQGGESYEQALNGISAYGMNQIVRLRDTKPSEHVSKIKLSDSVAFAVLMILSVFGLLYRSPPSTEYYSAEGVRQAIVHPVYQGPAAIPRYQGFLDIRDETDLWNWLNTRVPEALMQADSDLRKFNLPIGYLQLRQQRARVPPAEDVVQFCARKSVVLKMPGAECLDSSLVYDGTEPTQDKSDLTTLEVIWEGSGDEASRHGADGRGDTYRPWQFAPANTTKELSTTAALRGSIQQYDESGYIVEYNLNEVDLAALETAFRKDMVLLRDQKWIDRQSRMIVLAFATYNPIFDFWCSCTFLVEMPPSGVFFTKYWVQPFRPNMDETNAETSSNYFDYLRFAIVLYIFLFVFPAHIVHKTNNHKAGLWAFVNLTGICDMIIIVFFYVAFAYRWALFKLNKKTIDVVTEAQTRFYDFYDLSQQYWTIQILEGVMFVALCIRMLAFARLNRSIFQLWRVLGAALQQYMYFALLFIPLFLGFCFTAHTIWGRRLFGFDTFWGTIIATLMMINGNVDLEKMSNDDGVWTVIFVVLFFFIFSFFLMNAFTAIMIESMYKVFMSSGNDPKDQNVYWNRDRWMRWMCPQLCMNLAKACRGRN